MGVSTSDPSQLLTIQSATFPVIEVANYSDNNPTDGVALDLIEKQPSYASASNTFGQTGVYGYRIKLNGSDNTLRIKSGSQTTVTDRVTLTRDEGTLTLNTGNLHLLGSVDQRIQISTSGSGSSPNTGNNNIHIRGNDDTLILNCAGNGNMLFQENSIERMRIATSTGALLVGTTTGKNNSNTIEKASGS